MPSKFYRYDNERGEVVEVERTVRRERPMYPIACEAMAVHPSQIAEAVEHDARHGVKTEYRTDGTPIMRDPGHYRKYRRLHGVHFKEAYDD